MKCEYCNQEFSDSIYPLHILRCSARIKSEQTEVPQSEIKPGVGADQAVVKEEMITISEKIQPEQIETTTGKKKKGK